MQTILSGKNTKYLAANVTTYNIRPNEDYIFVNTSLNPVTLYLPSIVGSGLDYAPKNFYVSDLSNNASVNNITILATTDQLNSGASVKITNNGGTGIAQIASNSEWFVALDSVSAGGGITGSGSVNTLPLFTGAMTIGNSKIFQDSGGTLVSVNAALTVLKGATTLAASTALYPSLQFTTGGAAPSSPLNGMVYYTDAAGFTFYSVDGANANDLAHFTNGTNTLAFYADSANDFVIYTTAANTILSFSTNGGSVLNYGIDGSGNHSWVSSGQAAGVSTSAFRWTGAAKTNQTASTQQPAFIFTPGAIQFAAGALATQTAVSFLNQTITFVSASTIASSATVTIAGAPISGTNATQSLAIGLLVKSAAVGTSTASYGINVSAMTGSTINWGIGINGSVQIIGGRMVVSQGAPVASANNLVVGFDANAFEITGTTQINLISNTTWANGSIITLLFTSTPTVKNAQASSGANITILLAGGVDFVATANDTLTLMLSSVGGTQAWREISRALN